MNFQGESLFLRAFIHFDLLRLFGEQGPSFGGMYPNNKDAKGIILMEGIADASNAITARSTIEECYQLIIKDLKKPKPALETTRSRSILQYPVPAIQTLIIQKTRDGPKNRLYMHYSESVSVYERLCQCQDRI